VSTVPAFAARRYSSACSSELRCTSRFRGNDLSVEHIELQVADAQARYELPGVAVGPAKRCPCARDTIVRNEGNTDVVIGAALEGIKLASKIAAPGQRDDTHRPSGARLIDELNTCTCL
jgi:hypothetical protein